jgi:hypothetical protein
MKTIGAVMVGIMMGVAGTLGAQALPASVTDTAKARMKDTVEIAKDTRYNYCQRGFYRETECRQKLPPAECDRKLYEACGPQ